jgi:hypothetical protein
MLESADIIKILHLFNYEFHVNSLMLCGKKRNDNTSWKALDAAWKCSYHAEICLEENIVLRRDDNDVYLRVQHTDYRKIKCDGHETDMKLLAKFAKKHNLVVTYTQQERNIQQYIESLNSTREEMYFFKKCLSE